MGMGEEARGENSDFWKLDITVKAAYKSDFYQGTNESPWSSPTEGPCYPAESGENDCSIA